MNEEKALTKTDKVPAPVTARGIQIKTVDDLKALASLITKEGMVPKDDLGKPGKVAVKIQFGLELGLTPFAAIRGIAVINGMPSLWGDTMIGLCHDSGKCEDIKLEEIGEVGKDSRGYKVIAKRRGMKTPFMATFTIADARQAGLYPGPGKGMPWDKYPHRMCLNRARAFVLRDAFPDVLQGLTSYEEVRDMAVQADFTVENAVPKTAKEKVNEAIEKKSKKKSGKKKEPEVEELPIVDTDTGEVIEPEPEPDKEIEYKLISVGPTESPNSYEPPKQAFNKDGNRDLPF